MAPKLTVAKGKIGKSSQSGNGILEKTHSIVSRNAKSAINVFFREVEINSRGPEMSDNPGRDSTHFVEYRWIPRVKPRT